MDRRAEDAGGSGAGGKLTKRTFRPRPTPYARPPREEARQQPLQRKKADGWLSKLFVQPAARVLPSLFSSARHQGPPPSESLPENEQEDHDGGSTLNHDNQFPESEEPSAAAETGPTKVGSMGDEIIEDKGDADDGSELAKIEQRFKHKMFTRDETNRLIELLRSRTIDTPDDNGHAAGFIVEAAEVTLDQKDSRTLGKEDAIFCRISEPLQLTAQNVSSSPIDIAKAYMGARKSASEHDCQTVKSKSQKRPINDDSSTIFFSSAAKSPVCWPGAVVHGDHGYLTPQTQGGRTGPRNFPRTPYSGALFSRSTSKFQGGGERPNLSSAGWKQSTTPVFGGNSTKRSSVFDDGFASVNPIHHVRQKSMSTTSSNGAGPSNPASSFSLLSNSPDGSKGISSTFQGDHGEGSSKGSYRKFHSIDEDDEASRFTVGSSSVHPQSSKMARRILEHLDRPVFPKEKSLELELAFARAKVPPKSAALSLDGQDKRHVSFSDDPKSGCLLGRDMGAQESVDAQKVIFGASTSKSQDKDQLSFPPPQNGKQESFGSARNAADFKSFQAPKPLPRSESPIPASRPGEKVKSSDNGFSFTFPVTPASNVFTEPPPTPTMNSSLAAGRMVPTTTEETVPLFSFGSSRADSRLVFSFGSIANSTITDNTGGPKFKFGSDEKRNLSFKSADKDAICY